MIWTSRHFHKANPQNLLRPPDLMRILVPWRAFGDLAKAQQLVAVHEQKLLDEEEAEWQRRLQEIEDVYASILEPPERLTAELARLEGQDWRDAGFSNKADYSAKVKELKRQIKDLEKIQAERDKAEAEVNEYADREIAHIHEAAAHLLKICSDRDMAGRYFVVTEVPEIEYNEFNMNMPRYVDTFRTAPCVRLEDAIRDFASIAERKGRLRSELIGALTVFDERGGEQ